MESTKAYTPINGIVEPDFLEYLTKTFKRWKSLYENQVAVGTREISKFMATIQGARLNSRFGFEAVTHQGTDKEGENSFTLMIYKNREAVETGEPLFSFSVPICK